MTIETSPETKKAAPKPRKAAAKTAVLKPAAKAKPVKPAAVTLAATASPGKASPSQAESFVTQAQDTVRKVANTSKDRATDALGELAGMIEDVAKTIDDRVGGAYGDYARKASGSITGVADNLKSKDVDQLLDDAREFVRTQPAVAIGAAAAVGFVLTRLIKSGRDDNA
jgi:ElaB/YqjD/DUF883 family membrane-anchored ribosome-binding protein